MGAQAEWRVLPYLEAHGPLPAVSVNGVRVYGELRTQDSGLWVVFLFLCALGC